MRRGSWLAGALVLLVATAVPVALAGSKAAATAEATIASGSAGTHQRAASSGSLSEMAAGGVAAPGLSIGHAEARATTSKLAGKGAAKASAVARTISIFDGLVTAYGVRRTAEATSAGVAISGQVDGLKVDGKSIGTVSAATSFPFEGGSVSVNGAAALTVTLTKARGSFPAGASISIASVSASASDAVRLQLPVKPAAPKPQAKRRPAPKKLEDTAKAAAEAPPPARLVGSAGHAFPIAGPASVGDDFHGARQIGPHQGNDIYAPFGTPVVAVADGVIEKVGTLSISGNRLWLRTRGGDEFFYAHMSSFSPIARNGRRVKAGAVLGFVGNTGDAEPTPPHLHFEIHPGGGKAVDPHAVLSAWQARARRKSAPRPRPGALVEVRDFLSD